MNKATTIYSLKDLCVYFLRLGAIGFGGPVALVEYMRRDLVEQRKWIKEEDYKEGMALAQLAPGPLAAQLGIYIGYVDYGIIGATLSGIAFVLPSFVMVVTLGYAYVHASGMHWMQAVFYGVGSSVIGIIAVSGYKLSKKNLGSQGILWIIAVTLALITFITEREIVWLILLGGFVMWVRTTALRWKRVMRSILYLPILLQAASSLDGKLIQLSWFSFKAGAVVFGSGLAIVPFLYGGVVKEFQWLNEQQFLDAVAVAMITPGPVVITVGFIGFLVAGLPGACVASLATFLPCYLFTLLLAPYFRKYGKRADVKAFIEGVTAAAIGAILGAVGVLAKRQLTDLTSVIICTATIIVLMLFRRIPEPYIIIVAAIVGLIIS